MASTRVGLSMLDAASNNLLNSSRVTERMRGRLSLSARLFNTVIGDVSAQPRRIPAVRTESKNDRSRRWNVLSESYLTLQCLHDP